MYNAVIIDDQEICITVMRMHLSPFAEVHVAGTAQEASTGKDLIIKLRPDLLFLDVELGNASGFDMLRETREIIDWPMYTIVFTSNNKYAVHAFRESVDDFLPKSTNKDELKHVMSKFFNKRSREIARPQSRLDPMATSPLMIPTITGFEVLYANEIAYLIYCPKRKQWSMVLSNNNRLPLKRNTSASSLLAYSPSFIQINQHQIINIGFLARIEGNTCILRPPFQNLRSLTISRIYYKLMQQQLNAGY